MSVVTRIRTSQELTVPFTPKEVWSVLEDVAAYPEWWPAKLRVEVLHLTDGLLGTEFEVRPFLGRVYRMRFEELEGRSSMRLRFFGGSLEGPGGFHLMAVEGETRVRYEMDVFARGLDVAALSVVLPPDWVHRSRMRSVLNSLASRLKAPRRAADREAEQTRRRLDREHALRQAEEEAAARRAGDERARWLAAGEEALRRAGAEEERRRAEADAAARAAAEEQRRRPAEEEANRRAAEEAAKKRAEEDALARAAAEEAERRAVEEEARARAAAEEAERRAAEEKAKAHAAAEEADRVAAEAEASRLAAVEEKKRSEEEAAAKAALEEERRRVEEEEAGRRAAEEAAKKRAEEEALARAAAEEAERRAAEEARARAIAEEAERRAVEEEEARLAAAEAKKRAEEEAAARAALEEAQRRAAEEEANRLAAEDAAKKRADDEAVGRAAEESARASEQARRESGTSYVPGEVDHFVPERARYTGPTLRSLWRRFGGWLKDPSTTVSEAGSSAAPRADAPERETNFEIARRYLDALSSRVKPEDLVSYFAPDVTDEEFPHRFLEGALTRDLDGFLGARARSMSRFSSQRYELAGATGGGSQVALEVRWRGSAAKGSSAPDQEFDARIAIFLKFVDGRIVRQRTYPCFEPWSTKAERMMTLDERANQAGQTTKPMLRGSDQARLQPAGSNFEIARRYLDALSARADADAIARFFAEDAVQDEFPNRLLPGGAHRDLAAIKVARSRGLALMASENHELVGATGGGSQVALEVAWSGVVGDGLGLFTSGQKLEARLGIFLKFRDGLIVAQRNYDCPYPDAR